ncbi:helix-turn-helix domain-containing protein [Acidithiobacillus ferrivorans]|uniref:helix-turn-helix domain-containing protein n=1 Tax=Acidithiobacillus ferrivorans TaxID=160808 RepID=UPI001C400650|nr:hypothetical protein [Acidithiobacillus ferrivorans]
MEIKAIHDEAGYRAALAELDRTWDAPKGSPGSDRMEVLTILIADYERQHHAIEDPDPIALLESMSWRRAASPARIWNPASDHDPGFPKCSTGAAR